MIRDITIGQFFPGQSVVHRMDPRMKILLTIVYMVMLFTAFHYTGLVVASVFILIVAGIARIPVKLVLRGVRPIVPVILLTSVINACYVPGRTLFRIGVANITYEGVSMAIFMSVRVVFLIVGASMMTYTTSPIALTDGLEQLLSPLKKIHLPVHELSMMMTIALRFIPTLVEETDKIISAQKARGADFETGNLMRRMRALMPILIPLFVSAFRRAEELALAMDCRCYQGGEGRTRLHQLQFGRVDFMALAVMAATYGVVIWCNIRLPY